MAGDGHDENLAAAVYQQMRSGQTPTLAAAAESLRLTAEETELARKHLDRLGLLVQAEKHPDAILHVNPEIAIVQALARGRQDLDEYRHRIASMHEHLEQVVSVFLPLGVGSGAPIRFEVMDDLQRVAAYLESATDLARSEVLTMHPGPVPAAALLAAGHSRNQLLAQRDLRMRTIYQRRVADAPHMAEHLRGLEAMGYEIRVAELVPARMLIFDRRRVVIPLDPHNGRAGAVAIEGEPFVHNLVSIFDFCWHHAAALASLPEESEQISPEELTVLRMLASGLKDERIARDLGVSLRTVSRMISDLMQRIGAESRFQAGVNAAALGLLR